MAIGGQWGKDTPWDMPEGFGVSIEEMKGKMGCSRELRQC